MEDVIEIGFSQLQGRMGRFQHLLHVLAQDVTREEIKHPMFSLKNKKAPGLDGFNAGFFKRMWHIVGEDVINAVSSFF